MAGVFFRAVRDAIASGTALKTLVQLIAATNVRVRINRIIISTDGGTSSAVPILITLAKQTSAGTLTGLTLVKNTSADPETLQTTAGHTATAEPTTTDIYDYVRIHPQGGRWEYVPNTPLYVPGGTRFGILVTAAATVNCTVTVECEE